MRKCILGLGALIASAGAAQGQMMMRPVNPQAQAQALIHAGFPLGFFQLPGAAGMSPLPFAPFNPFASVSPTPLYGQQSGQTMYMMNPYMPYPANSYMPYGMMPYGYPPMYSNTYMPGYP